MVGIGRVIGGDYLNGLVTTPAGSTVVVQTGLKLRKLSPDNVTEWDEVVSDGKGAAAGAVRRAVVGAARAGHLGKVAAAAVEATREPLGSSHVVRVEWSDGKTSLLKLPDTMFRHLEIVLKAQRAEQPEPARSTSTSTPVNSPTAVEQAFSLVSGMVKDRFPPRATAGAPVPAPPDAQPDIVEQLTKLASLHDAGILTDEEFSAKKAEMLARF